jgi:ribonuclease BN (tRNA processing enzyme)
MKLIMLGTGGFVPTDEAQTACYFLPEHNILLDGGTGLYRLSRYMQSVSPLDVYLSHSHGDHTSGLIYLFASYFKKLAAESPLPVDENYINNLMKRANELSDSTRVHFTYEMLPALKKQFPYPRNWQLLDGCESLAGGGTLNYFAFDPAREEIGFRLDWPGHSLAYVTDTIAGPNARYIDKIAGVDLLLHDCNLPDNKANIEKTINHSSTSSVAQIAAKAGVKRLVLIHSNPLGWAVDGDLPAARKIFPATELGRDGMEVEF